MSWAFEVFGRGWAQGHRERHRGTMVPVAAQASSRDAIVRGAPWVALLVVGCVMEAVGIHQLLSGGECSSTGYTRFGPAPECPSSTGWYIALVSLGLPLAICSGASKRSPVQGWHFFLGFFGAIGVGALTSTAPTAFRLVFGGGFVLFGAALGLLFWKVKRSEDAVIVSERRA